MSPHTPAAPQEEPPSVEGTEAPSAAPEVTHPAPEAARAAAPAAENRRMAYMPRLPRSTEPEADEWLLSYADMATLLLTLFVALLLNASFEKAAPSNPIGGRSGSAAATAERAETGAGQGSGEGQGAGEGARGFLGSILQFQVVSPYVDGEAYSVTAGKDAPPLVPPDAGAELAVVKDADLERIRRREETLKALRYRLTQADLDTYVTATVEGDGIRLNIPNSILFATGQAQLQERGEMVVRALAPIVAATSRFTISVEGHTDDVPIKTDRFPSNWELSAQRAATVVRVLSESGVPSQRLEAVGYADSRPLSPNTREDGRTQNRRVTLFLRLQP